MGSFAPQEFEGKVTTQQADDVDPSGEMATVRGVAPPEPPAETGADDPPKAGEAHAPLLAERYRLVREIGRGGFGVVWLAEDTMLDGRQVAIKLLDPGLLNDPAAVETMQREAAVALDLTHPRVVRLHTFDRDGERSFLVFEYLAGPTLTEILRSRQTLTLEEAALILEQACEALGHIHGSEVVHCDIKPSNIMLESPLGDPATPLAEENCQLKLTDLGIARPLLGAAAEDESGLLVGTPTHMSPDLLRGEAPTPASDIYSMGCVLYQLLAGRPPFQGDDVVYQQMHSVPPEPEGVPASVIAVVQRCLAKAPRDRWPSAQAMAMAFRAAVDEAKADEPAPPPDPSTLPADFTGPLKMPFRLVPGGAHKMGSPDDDPDHHPCEGPVHEVVLDPFYVGTFPVTVSEYEAFLWQTRRDSPHLWDEQRAHPRRPVVYVSWGDAAAFCEWMSRIGKRRFRLPTEAEWECAARGGRELALYPWGDEPPDDHTVHNPDVLLRDGSDWSEAAAHLCDVGSFEPNDFSLHDMAGLVAEWCQDLYQEDYYAESPDRNPTGPTRGGRRVIRGGSWRLKAPALRCAARLMVTPESRCPDFGFRVVREV